ncbi:MULTISPECIES: DEAD/DEAH box helicase [Bacillaceae]|uniref:DEAD/DEAH box helicase family protein n=1 Tax=Evansella alkalicola TaxID=745819 RepID=A0ABS6JNY0_9BACI|nr:MULTISPECIES: DEAD/DEAH box helicase family protein [Bacillaceae]MBU9720274.1 DEAD/DEAH box helicase family protein [Bacillus alkalicola]
MNAFPTEHDIKLAVTLLVDHYKVPEAMIEGIFGAYNYERLNQLLDNLGENQVDIRELTRMLVVEKGAQLFAGSSVEVRKLREHMLRQLPEQELIDLYNRNPATGRVITTPSYMYRPLYEKMWRSGGPWPRDFVRTLGFPIVFSGISLQNTATTEPVIDIEARKSVPPLVDFQLQLKERMLEVLNLEGEKTRCVVTLPTGGGKTRVAVESFIEWMHQRFSEGKYMLWIAQSEELCEQAIACITDMWQEKEFPESLRVYRYFAGKTIKEEQLIGGAVVASIQQIYSRIVGEDPVLEDILRNCGAMIIDEAHHAAADSYGALLEKAEELCGPDLFPICGLTATPGRNNGETTSLVKRFQAYLIQPDLPKERKYEENPLLYFREKGYLAKPKHLVFQSGRVYEVNENEVEKGAEDLLTPELLEVLANDEVRNYRIVERLLEIPRGKQTLVYTCTVEHAEYLTSVLNAIGRKSASISANTPKVARRMYIDAFKNGELEFLFNYGVLTTGFDAPNTEYIVICRPTTSELLYEQIVGRGLRGPKFGGTSECTIIDFADNLLRLGKPLAYQRFHQFWEAGGTLGTGSLSQSEQ